MEQTTYVDERLQRLTARLQQLELHAATTGIDTPPHVNIEIDNLRQEIEQVKMSSKSLISLELLQRMEPVERWKRLYDSIWEVEILLYTLQKNTENDRIRTQKRHMEFNVNDQRATFEIELLKRNLRKTQYILSLLVVFIVIALYILR